MQPLMGFDWSLVFAANGKSSRENDNCVHANLRRRQTAVKSTSKAAPLGMPIGTTEKKTVFAKNGSVCASMDFMIMKS